MTLVVDNLPWIVKTHFDFQDMLKELLASEFCFHLMMYPFMTFGLIICTTIFTFMFRVINQDLYGRPYLDSLDFELREESYQPK